MNANDMTTLVVIAVIFALPVFFGICCGILADRKNRARWSWALGGFLFGVFALILIAALKPLAIKTVHW